MRALKSDELDVVGGAYGRLRPGDVEWDPDGGFTVTVRGGGPRAGGGGSSGIYGLHGYYEFTAYPMEDRIGPDHGSGGWVGQESDTPRDTPCVTDKPTKHGNILDIHQAAIDLKEKMPYQHSLIPGEKFEYFGLIWKLP